MLHYEVTQWRKVDTLLSRHFLTTLVKCCVPELYTQQMALVNKGPVISSLSLGDLGDWLILWQL